MTKRASRSLFALAGTLALTVPVQSLPAQAPHFKNTRLLGAGWVANIPTSHLGFSVIGMTPGVLGGAGVYADVKFTSGSPRQEVGFIPGVTPEEAELAFGDRLFAEESDWVTVDLALVYAVTPEFALYGGGGYSKEEHYREYYDNGQERGEFGFYWVEDAGNTGSRANLMGGAIMRIAPVALVQAGGQTAPAGVTVGVILTLPR